MINLPSIFMLLVGLVFPALTMASLFLYLYINAGLSRIRKKSISNC